MYKFKKLNENTKNAEKIINEFWKQSEKVQKELAWMDKNSAKQFKNIMDETSEVIDYALSKEKDLLGGRA